MTKLEAHYNATNFLKCLQVQISITRNYHRGRVHGKQRCRKLEGEPIFIQRIKTIYTTI